MSDELNKTIQTIALKHGVALGKDDPILILHTMNEKLVEENRKAQQDMLAQFKEEMESISSQWKEDAREKAEKVLNAALASSKEAMVRLLQESVNESVQAMKKMRADSLAEAHDLAHQTKIYSRLAFLSSVMLVVSCIFIFFFII